MKFIKALKYAMEVGCCSEYCTTMYRKSKGKELGFEVDGIKIRPMNLIEFKPIYKRSFDIDDFLANDWVVMDAYGEVHY